MEKDFLTFRNLSVTCEIASNDQFEIPTVKSFCCVFALSQNLSSSPGFYQLLLTMFISNCRIGSRQDFAEQSMSPLA